MKSEWKRVLTVCTGAIGAYVLMNAVAKKVTEDSSTDNKPCTIPGCQGDARKGQQNENKGRTGVYEGKVKPVIDRLLSFLGLVLLSPVFVIISLAIVINDPGPVLFTQKRVGKDKEIFMLHKFRSMKMKTPHDVPTHQLENPEQYITRIGKFLRKYSLDGRIIIGQPTENLENKGFREVSPILFHRGCTPFSTVADLANIESVLCRSA